MTINQALEKILSKYKNDELDKYPAITRLKLTLIDLKITWGGNTPIENTRTINKIIETGKD